MLESWFQFEFCSAPRVKVSLAFNSKVPQLAILCVFISCEHDLDIEHLLSSACIAYIFLEIVGFFKKVKILYVIAKCSLYAVHYIYKFRMYCIAFHISHRCQLDYCVFQSDLNFANCTCQLHWIGINKLFLPVAAYNLQN